MYALQIAGQAKRVAVLGIAPESRADRAAHYVAKSLQDDGVQIVPVPVYYLDARASVRDQATSKYSTCMAKVHAHSHECICAKHPMSWRKMHLHICALCQLVGAALLTCIERQCIPAMQETLGEKIPRRLQGHPECYMHCHPY